MMQSIAGGAAARPFITHHNALNIDLFMRVSPELYLKRLLVGGIERVFEINRNFRNEGIDTTHNPEFTMMEVYQAYSDLAGMMELTESLFVRLAGERLASLNKDAAKLHLPYGERVLDFSPPFDRVSYAALFQEKLGVEMFDVAAVRRVAEERGMATGVKEHDVIVGELFERFAEGALAAHDRPVFLYDYPAALCPLTRRKPGEPRIAERFELYVAGMELANAYTELNDPVVQEETFSRQLAGQKEEDSMATSDDDFINALRHGMPPAGGLGVGIDRLAMVMTNRQSIRDVVLFPLLKPLLSEMDERRAERDTQKLEQQKAEALKAGKIPVFFVLDKDGNLRIVDLQNPPLPKNESRDLILSPAPYVQTISHVPLPDTEEDCHLSGAGGVAVRDDADHRVIHHDRICGSGARGESRSVWRHHFVGAEPIGRVSGI